MKPETVSPLGPKGARLLAFLVREIDAGRIRKNEPETFVAYSEALEGMKIVPKGRASWQLRYEGLAELSRWTLANPALPKIAALIVNKQTRKPGRGFATSHGHEENDWERWWLAEATRAIEFDWSPYLHGSASGGAESVQEQAGGGKASKADYQGIIVAHPPPARIRRSGVTVKDVLGWLAQGQSENEILRTHRELRSADIRASLAYAADREIQSVTPSFTERWTGKFKLREPNPEDDRLTHLLERYKGIRR